MRLGSSDLNRPMLSTQRRLRGITLGCMASSHTIDWRDQLSGPCLMEAARLWMFYIFCPFLLDFQVAAMNIASYRHHLVHTLCTSHIDFVHSYYDFGYSHQLHGACFRRQWFHRVLCGRPAPVCWPKGLLNDKKVIQGRGPEGVLGCEVWSWEN